VLCVQLLLSLNGTGSVLPFLLKRAYSLGKS
jgi:hypothetical protein